MATWHYTILSSVLFILATTINGDIMIYVDNSASNRINSSLCWKQGSPPCASLELGLKGLILSNTSSYSRTLMIANGIYKLNTPEYSQFNLMNNIEIKGYNQPDNNNISESVFIQCSSNVGFSFIDSENITLSNIVFDGCGQLYTSTSFNLDVYYPNYVPFIVSLYFLYCRDVTLNEITVQNTPSGVGTVIYNTNGQVSINDCYFYNNRFQPNSSQSGGGGLYIEFSFCDPLNRTCLFTNTSNVKTSYTRNANYTITNTVFHYNRANISLSNVTKGTYILPYGKYHNAFGRGGGLSVYLIGNVSDVIMTINNCTFTNNSALWGGGMLVELHDNAHFNYILVKNSRFIGNYLYYDSHLNAGTGGGGARVAMFMFPESNSYVYDNNVIFTNCTFNSNNAYYGGGLSYYTTLQSDSRLPNHVQLYNCNFTANIARLGAALDLSIFHPSTRGISPNIMLYNIRVIENKALYHNKEGAPVGIGAVYIDTLHVVFEGMTIFERNTGCALVLSGCHIDVNNDTMLNFTGNLARSGGAIVLYAGSYIITHYGSEMRFVKNVAEYYGGAIYNYNSGVRDQFASGNCFLRFSNIFTAPDKWKSYLYFEGNSANGKNNSIYTSTVLPCVWGSAHGTTDSSDSIIKQVFCWNNDNWMYRDTNNKSVNCSTQISTAVSKYILNDTYSLIPGDTVSLNVEAWDDMSNVVTERAVFILKIDNGPGSFTGNAWYNYSYVSQQEFSLVGLPNNNITLEVTTDNPIILESQINVTLKQCPPGFYLVPNEGTWYYKCICDQDYMGHIRCNQSNYTSSILRTGWIGQSPKQSDNKLVFGTSLYIQYRSSKQFIQLPQDPNDLPEFLCDSSNRKGVICGSCKDGYGVPADLLESSCVKCPPGCEKYTWIYYLLTEFLPVTIFFAIVFIFSVTVTLGPLNSFIFFAQVITTVMKVDADGEIFSSSSSTLSNILQSIYIIPYSVWNLDFFRTVLPRYCLHPSLNTLDLLNLSYIQVLYLIGLLFLFVSIMHLYSRGVRCVVCLCRPLHYCLARFRQWTNLRQSITGGIAGLVVIAYTKFVLLALYCLTPVHLMYSDGTKATTVFYLDGDLEYNIKNIKYILPSIIVLIAAAIATVLLAYPSLLALLSYITCNKLPLGRLYPSHKLQAFLDEFHGCYRNGSDGGIDCRWFASFYFCIRVILIAVYTISDSYGDQFTIQSILFIITAGLFVLFQPYRVSWLNKLDPVMFLLMSAISSFSNYNLSLIRDNMPLNQGVLSTQYILILIPLVYCIGYYMTLFCKNKKMPKMPCHKQRPRTVYPISVQEPTHLTDSRSDSYQSALVDSTHVPNFIDFMENTGRMRRQNVRLNNPQNWSENDAQRRDETTPLVSSSRRRDRRSTGSTNDYHTPTV